MTPPNYTGLTPRQRDLLAFIHGCEVAGFSPSMDEMCLGLGLNSKNSISHLVKSLEERGSVSRVAGKSRSVRIVRHSLQDSLQDVLKGFKLSEFARCELEWLAGVNQ
jgi:SOS-response transcriptional repressor LexA